MDIFQAIVLAIVEGITEYLPVSSTGHMIIASSMMGIAANDFCEDVYCCHSIWRNFICNCIVLETVFSIVGFLF
jgi:hypothetical protein